MKRLLGFLVLATPLSLLSCGQVSTSPDGGGAAGTTGSGGTTGSAGTTGSGGTTGSAGTTGRGGTTGSAGTTGGGGAGGGSCTYAGMTYPAGTSFPDLDGCNTCACTAGGQIACTLRACPPDAGAPACAFDAVYRFGMTGGRVIYEDRVTLTPPASYLHARVPVATDPISLSCAPPLPACDAAAIDVSDVMRDVADPDVQKALALATPPLYGTDPRPVDGNIFSFQRGDGRGFLAGGQCTGSGTSCVAIPAGIVRLVATLRALDEQQLKDASCASLR